jgi:hypothetical protein
MNTRMVLLPFIAGVLYAQENAQPPQAKTTGTVDGKALNSISGEPIGKVQVLLQPRNGGPQGVTYVAVTDGNGHFLMGEVEPGEYTISATRQNFMLKGPGASGAPLPPVRVERGQTVRDVAIPMAPLGVIAGRVMDEDGDPIRGAVVRAMQYSYVAAKRQLRNVQQTTANDKGEFRLWGLRPGTFYLQAIRRTDQMNIGPPGEQTRGRQPTAPAPTYYPTATDAAHAAPIEVSTGALLRGIDIRLRRDALFAIRGKLTADENLQNFGGYNLQLMSTDGNRSTAGVRWTHDVFEFSGVLPGSYVIKGMHMEADKRTFVSHPVEVAHEDVDVGALSFLPGFEISGAVGTDGAARRPPGLRVSLQPVGPGMFSFPSAEVKPDGSFVLKDVAPDIYQVNFSAGMPNYVKFLRLGDRELTDRRVDLTGSGGQLTIMLAADVGEVEGSVRNGKGEPAAKVRVTLVPEGGWTGREDLSRFAFSDEKGEFKIRSVPPGDYKIFAWEDVPAGAPQDPEFRKPFEKKGLAIRLEPNGHGKADLVVISTAEMRQLRPAAEQ